MATILFAVAIAVIILPGGENNYRIWGVGKFAVVALAISSSLRPKTSSPNIVSSKNSNHRDLETCTFNVEILIDGCSKSIDIVGGVQLARVVDVVVKNQTEDILDNGGGVNYEATLTFPVTEKTQVLDLEVNNSAEAIDEWDYQCQLAVVGRPFVDAKGNSLTAMPAWNGADLSWTGEALLYTEDSLVKNNSTFLLSQDWIQRGLGEHASVASFSAFAISLMTNQAPIDLIEKAFKAGLDEIRHVAVSFDIVKQLTGKVVGPGPLPPSNHEFHQDMTALALAVAREGCVDETLSAYAAAIEVEHITQLLGSKGVQDSPYAGIDTITLAFIRDRLITIAMDESNHSALSWRTLQWVCSIDTDACDAVQRDVFAHNSLETRFNKHAAGLFINDDILVLSSMKDEWMKILSAFQSSREEKVCKKDEWTTDDRLLSTVTENVIRQLSCN